MDSIPFGVSRFDSILGGGAPAGSVVLLAGESGAGAREFLYTSATMNALGHADPDLFELHYGDLHEDAALPPEIHYVSFTSDETDLRREMTYTMANEIVESALDGIEFRDFSPEYFQSSPVPREWYLGETTSLIELGNQSGSEDLLNALGTYLSERAPGSLVLIDSVTDLVAATSDEMGLADIALLLKGLAKASHRWGSLILLHVSVQVLSDVDLGHVIDAVDGTITFEWESGGSTRARTMVVQEFRGVLARLEAENIVRFETEIHEGGLDVSDVRKIR